MAYLVDLTEKCAACGKRASVELRNAFNAPLGVFCKPCGRRRLAATQCRERAVNSPNA